MKNWSVPSPMHASTQQHHVCNECMKGGRRSLQIDCKASERVSFVMSLRLHLLLATRDNIVLCILGVSLHFNALLTAGSCHGERPDFGAMVLANLLLFCIEANSLPYQVPTAIAPHIKRHLKSAGQTTQGLLGVPCYPAMPSQPATTCADVLMCIDPIHLMTRMPWSIFLALSLRGCWPCCLFMLPFFGSHSGGK